LHKSCCDITSNDLLPERYLYTSILLVSSSSRPKRELAFDEFVPLVDPLFQVMAGFVDDSTVESGE
jgi:hypothetical protein